MPLDKLSAEPVPEHKVQEFEKILLDASRSFPGLCRTILFGSAARGHMTTASDLDVLFIFDSKENAQLARMRGREIRRKLCWPADFLFVDQEKYDERSQIGGVLFVAREEGRIIFLGGGQ